MTEPDLHDGDDFADLDDLPQTEAEQLVRRVLDVIETARPVPLSTSAMINKEEVVVLLEQALAHFPREMRESRWLLKERTEFLAKAREEAEEIIARARTRAERMVQRNEVVREADRRARQIIDAAEADARRMRLEVEDYCDKKLGSFEIVLERTMKLVQQGRERLQLASSRLSEDYPDREADAVAAARAEGTSGFFDQDVP